MKEVTPLLEKLAERLGVGVEILWAALLRQAPIEGLYTLLVWPPIFTAMGYGLYRWGKAILENDWDELAWLPLGLCAAAAVISLCIWVAYLPTAIAGVLNPEYWALKRVLSALK